jgi:hypothetical protein
LKTKLSTAAQQGEWVALIGDLVLCRDVAETYHRLAELPSELLVDYTGPESMNREVWPAGTVYAEWSDRNGWCPDGIPEGWRLVVAAPSEEALSAAPISASCRMTLPAPAELGEDLPKVLGTLTRSLDLKLSPDAIRRLGHFAVENGFEKTRQLILAAAEGSGGFIEAEQLPIEGYGVCLFDELLNEDDPLRAGEARLITEVLCRCGWRMQDAADRLGMSRVTLWRKLREHGIVRGPTR